MSDLRATRDIRITAHAIQRWQQRVDPTASWLRAHLVIRRFLNQSRTRPTPRHWMRRPAVPGTTFAYSANQPRICVVLVGGAAVTVITRELVQSTPRLVVAEPARRSRALPPPIPDWIDDDLVA